MKNTVIFLLLLATQIFAQTKYRLNINYIDLPFDNKGIVADVIIDGSIGGKFENLGFLYDGGFLLAGYANDTLWANGVTSAFLLNDYLPGTINNDPSDSKNIIYVVKASDDAFGQSWQNWINAVELGADFYDGNNDNIYDPVDLNGNNMWDRNEDRPALIGDVMTWCVYNDEVPANQRTFNTVSPKGIEIQQTILAYASNLSPLSNTVFIRYRLINTGTLASKLDSVIFSIFTDSDLGDYDDDLIGCDTLLNSSFYYNDGDDSQYGDDPPSYFIKFLQGPISYIPNVSYIDNNGNNIF